MTANSLSHIASLFKSLDLKFRLEENRITAGFSFKAGDATLMVSLNSGGAIVNFELLGLIDIDVIRSSDHVGDFVQYLLVQNWTTSAGSVEMDSDGEVRVVLELPMADAVMTRNQMDLVVNILARHADALQSDGLSVLRTGKPLPKSEAAGGQDPAAMAENMAEAYMVFMELATTQQGRMKLQALAADTDAPDMLRAVARRVLTMQGPGEL